MQKPVLVVCGVGSAMDVSLPSLRDLGLELIVINDTITELTAGVARKTLPRDPCLPIDDELRELLRGESLSGVMALGTDSAVAVSSIAAEYGLPGVDPAVALRCTRKDLRIEALRAAGLATPRFAVADEVETALAALDGRVGYPAVAKPLDRSGSEGVTHLDAPDQAESGLSVAFAVADGGPVLLEQYLSGTEHTIGGIVHNGEFTPTGFSDRDYHLKSEYHPHYFESGDTIPSRLDRRQRTIAARTLAEGVRALGIDDSVINSDVLITEDGTVYLIEVTCRMAGARIATELIPLATGIDMLPQLVRLALGERVEVRSQLDDPERAVVQRFLPPEAGVVRDAKPIPAELRAETGIYDLFYCRDVKPGQRIGTFRDASDVLAGVIAWGSDVSEAEARATKALDLLPLVIDPSA